MDISPLRGLSKIYACIFLHRLHLLLGYIGLSGLNKIVCTGIVSLPSEAMKQYLLILQNAPVSLYTSLSHLKKVHQSVTKFPTSIN